MAETILRQNVIVQYTSDLDDLKRKSREAEQVVTGTGLNIKKALAVGGGIFAGIEIAQAIKGLSDGSKEVEKALSSLRAITGASEEDLQFYKETAIETGAALRVAASDVVQAYEVVGSAKPELLANKELLTEVTAAAITLSKASGDDLNVSVKALTGTLNQFNLTGDDSDRVINALAAGSKAGAAAVPLITDSLDKMGTVASSVNVTVEESVGLIETLAEKELKGAEAGTQLKNVLLNIAAAKALPKEAVEQLEAFGVNIDLVTDKSLPFNQRLAEMAKIGGDTTALIKVFGKENVTAAGILLNNVPKVEAYTKAVTGTSIAYEQAAIQIDNLEGDIDGLTGALEGPTIALGDFINKGLRVGIRFLTAFVITLKEVPAFLKENRVALLSLTAGILSFNAGAIAAAANTLRLAAAQRIQAIATAAAAIAQQGLNTAMRLNPIGLILTAVGFLALGLKALYDRVEGVRNVFAGLTAGVKEALGTIKDLFTGRIDLLEAGRRVANAYTKGLNDNAAKERAARAGKEIYDAFTDPLRATLIKNEPIGVLAKVQIDDVEDPTEKPKIDVDVVPDQGSISAFEERIRKLVDQYNNLNTSTGRGRDKARELVQEIKELTIEAERLRFEFEEALKRRFDPAGEIGSGNVDRIKKQLDDINTGISEAIQAGNTGLADALIIQRTLLENQIIEMAKIWQNPDLVIDQIKRFNVQIVEAIEQGLTEQARRLIAQKSRLESQTKAASVLSGDPDAIEEFTDLAEKALRERERTEKAFFDRQATRNKEQLDKQLQDREENRKQNREASEQDRANAVAELQNFGEEALGFAQSVVAARTEAYDRAIEDQEARVDRFREIAETGSARQLAIEQDRLDNLAAEREKAVEKERQLASAEVLASQAVTAAKSAEAISKAFSAGGPLGFITGTAMAAALLLSLTSAVSSVGGLFSGLPAFRDGTEYLNGPGNSRSDSIIMRGSRGERVVDAATNYAMAGIPNAKLPEAVGTWRSIGGVVGAIDRQTGHSTQLMKELITEQRETRRQFAAVRSQIVMTRRGLELITGAGADRIAKITG